MLKSREFLLKLVSNFDFLQNFRPIVLGKASYAESFYNFPTSCQIPNLGFIYEFFFGKSTGVLIEIGAHDGFSTSNSWGLIKRGWRAEMYEPIPEHFDLLSRRYSGAQNVRLHLEAVAGHIGSIRLFLGGMLTTSNLETFSEYSEIHWSKPNLTNQECLAPCITLEEAFNRVNVDVDLLIVDVEGAESEVFSSFDSILVKPRMLIVELAHLHPDLRVGAQKSYELFLKLLRFGYQVVYMDAINTILIRNDVIEDKYLK